VGRLACRVPLQRGEDPSSFWESVTGYSDASPGVGCPLELYEYRSIKHIGLPDPTLSPCFQRLSGFSSAPSPVPLRVRVHSLMDFASPSEFTACHPLDTNAEHLSWGFAPIRDMSVWSPLTAGLPTPGYVPPSAFLTLSTDYSSTHRAGLFHPTATSGIHTSGVSPAAKPTHLIDEPCPPAVSEILLTASCPAAARSTRFAFRAFVRAAVRCGGQAD
jgi:hypothetical protein